MQTGPERWGERTSQTGQSLGPNGLPANRNLRLTNEAIAELNSRVRSNPSLMQFTTQAAGRVIGGELSNMNGGLGAEAVASARLVSMVNSVAKPSETLLEPVRFSGEELKYLIRMSVERLSNRSFVNATRMTPLTGFVYDMDKYMCQACAFNTTSRLLFGEHLRCHAFKMPYLCGECGSKTILKNIPSHYCHKHRNCEPSVCAMATPLVDEIMQKLGPTAPYSVNKVDVQPNRQNAVPTCSASSFENIRPGGSGPVRTGHRSNFSLVDLTRDDEGLLQALINETNQQNLDMLAANCDYKDGVYMCNLCKFSTHRPFEIFEHVIADVQRWKCCCTACMSSDPRSCSVVKAAAAKLIRREQEAIGETGDFPPTMPITPIVIAPLGNHIAPDQYNVAVSQPAVVSDVPWQSPPTGSHSAANMQSRPPPCYYQTLVSTGRALPFTSEDVGSPPLYIQHARAASTASSAYQEASTTTIHWRPSQITSTESVSSNIPVRLRRQVLRIDSPAASRVNAPSTNLSTQRPTHVASSSFQPTRVVRITAAPTRPPPASEQSFPRPSAAPVSSTPLPEWLRPTLQELTVNLSREANKEKQLETETAVTSQAANGGSGQKQAAVAGSPAVRPTLNNTSGNMQDKGYPIVIELSDSSEDGQLEDTTVPPIPVPQSVPEKECNEESVTETATADSSTRKQTETSPNKRRTSDDQLGNIHRKKAFSKHKSSVRLAQVKRKKIAESDKHGNDSVPTGSAEEDVDKGNFFRCSIPNCGRSYCDPENLKTHIKRCHASLKIYSCPYCCCLWSDYNLLVDHILVHIGSKPYRCVQCDICFDTNIKLRNHFDDSHHVNMFFKCMVDGCEYDSKLWTEFKVHVSCCHPAEEAYTCFACGANFTNRTTYLRHLELGMETLICCAYCSMKSKLRFSIIRHLGSVHQGLAKKVTVHTEIKCGKGSKPTLQKFSAIEARQVLRRSTHEKTTIETPPVLQQSSHEKTAIETPPVLRRCTHCDFVDADKILVDAHVESHKSKRDLELTFSCTFCTFGSNNMHEYMQHLANHRGKVTQKLRYFRCPYCLFTSNQMALVEKHLDKKHREEPFKFEVQQKDVTTNGQVTGASPDVGHDGSPGRQKRTCAVVTQGGSNKKPQASCDPVSSNKRPKRVSTGPVMHKRLVILLERCTVPTTTPDTRTSQTRAKRKISTGEDCDDDKGLNRRHTKKSRTSRQTGVVKKTAGDQSEAVQSSTRACRLDHSVASLIDEYGVGDKEPMLSEDDDVEEEDSYWREMIRKSVSPEEKNAVQTSPSVLHKMHRDDSSSGVSVGECNVNEGEPVSENEDAYWRNIIKKKTNLDVVATEEKIVMLDEEDEDTYWIDVVKNSKHGKQSEGPRESCQSTTVRRSGRARLVASKSAGATGNRVSRDVGDIPMLSGGDFIRPQPATPGSSSSLAIAKYHCTSCEFLCRDLRLFNEHVRSSHEDSGSLASLVMTMTGDGTVTTERSSHKQATAAAMGQTAGLAAGSTTTPDAVVNNEDDKMKYHCNLCSIDCQDWEMFELHMTDVHGYSVIKTDTTSPFQDIVAVPIKKPVDRRKFSCNACSFSTHFKFNLKKHSVTHINRPHLQPTSSPRKGTSPRKRNIETRSKSDAKSSDTSQLVEPILSRNSGKIELRSRVKDAPVGDNDTGGAGDDGNTDHIHQVSFIKQVHADRLYKCKKCSYANDRIDRVERHVLRSHLYLMPYKCPYCASDSSDYNALLRHVSDLHRKKPTCVIYRVTGAPKCRKLVRRYIVDSTTQNAHDGRATSFILKSSKSNTSESVDSDKRIQKGAGSDKNGTTKVNDGVCGDNKGQDDSDVKELSKQLPCRKSSTSVLLWKCKTCPDRVSMLKEMQQHLLSQHLSLKPYKCGACPFSAVRTEMVDEHIRHTHSVEDHVVVLDMLVEKADSLRAMMVMVRRDAADSSNHQEHTPDQCQCGDEFDYELLRSISKNGNMVYDCDLCDYQASLKMSFIQHRKSHLQSTAVRCGYCDYRASSRHFLVNHISVAHPYRHVRYHLVHSNSTVASAELPCEGETLKDGKETMCVLSSLHTETTAPDKQRDTCIDMSDVVGAKKQEPTQSDEQDSSARRDTCTDIATTNDDVIESIGHPVEPPQGDCDYIVTLNIDCTDRLTEQKTDGSIEAKTDKSTEEKTDCSTEAKTDGSTGEKMDSTTEEKMNGLTEEKTDSLTKQKMDVVTEEMMDGATDEMTDGATEQTRDSSTEQKRDGLTEQTVEGSTEEKTNGSAEKKIDVATEEKMDGATEEKTGEKTDGSTEEKTDGLTGEKTDGSTEEKTNGLTGEKTDSLTEEKTDVATEETTDGVTDETTGGAKEEKTNGLAEETTDGATEGKTDGATEQNRDGLMEQTVDGSMEEKMNGLAEEKMDVATEEMADGATQEKTDCETEEKTDGATEEKTDCETEEKMDGATEEKTDCETEEKTDGATEEKTDCETEEKMHSSTEEKTDGSTEEKMDGLTEEKTDGSTEEKMDGSTEEKMDGLTEEKTDGATEQKRDGSTEQTVDGSMEENMNGLTEQKMDGSIDETTDGATEEIVDGGIDSQQMFMCVTCSMTMLLEQDIQHHIMVEHLEQKPYTCIYCDHSSADKRAVQLHTQKVHAGKPCSIIYETNGQLEAAIKENIVSVSSDTASQLLTPLVCNLCKKYTTRSMFQFLDHIAKEIKYTPYQCPYCSYSSIWRNAVKTHVAANHPQAQIRILLSEDVAQNRKILGLVKQCDSPHESDDKSDFNIFGDQTD